MALGPLTETKGPRRLGDKTAYQNPILTTNHKALTSPGPSKTTENLDPR